MSARTGRSFSLPTEAQWEFACRAGSDTPLSFGAPGDDFSPWANLADRALSIPPGPTGGLESSITAHHGKGIFMSAVQGGPVQRGNIACDARFDDAAVATSNVGTYRANPWGLCDMHGNAAEWTRTTYRPYPYDEGDGRNGASPFVEKVVRGGSFVDRPSTTSDSAWCAD